MDGSSFWTTPILLNCDTATSDYVKPVLVDSFNHSVNYLRLSVTDRCNERCMYCMPEESQVWLPPSDILSYEEVLRLVKISVSLGITKFRVTGGEPLVRKDVLFFLSELHRIPGVEDVGLTTNGTLLADNALALRRTGLRTLNISLDSLNPTTYAKITGRDFLPRVLDGIEAAVAAKFEWIKLNMVLIRGQNDMDVDSLIKFAWDRKIVLRFIELMPVSTREVLSEQTFISVGEIKKRINSHTPLTPDPSHKGNGPAVYYTDEKTQTLKLGFIGAMTNLHFCDSCNKLRLTAEGKLRPCLGNHDEYDVREALRNGATDEVIATIIKSVVARKPEMHQFRDLYVPDRKMIAIGG
ncbi:MAG: GTP 3',8-cyclase MoaA [Verrucomicrobiota bacterium]|nr:GTP 3',8-cyclase MoaA [Verrucomicrobiota bacterium]